MRFDVVSLFPEMFSVVRGFGVTGRAVERSLVELALWNPRDYAHDRHRSVDDRPYGGGPGMVMMIEPLRDAICAARAASGIDANVIALSPQGRPLDQAALRSMATQQRIILVAGRYEGIDERLIEMEVDEEYSIGDYVLSGGELAAMVLIDGVTRLLPGVLGHQDSAQQDSFGRGLLDCPHYTRPEEFAGRRVPEVLLGGNHAYIARWRLQQSLGRTWQRRPDLLEAAQLNDEERELLAAFMREQQDKVS
ncbi:MAG: tRNA (guanosine(37)-N1)-methyltransferase TrmD [Gammaproteobacteria bacterium]|nr:tRNA (guanosine(37)-N1)-methyltransferase TrmD [Gammaproteobacteria bacterium]